MREVECNYFTVEELLAGMKIGRKVLYEEFERACRLCSKGFLTQHGYLWSLPKDEELRKKLTLLLKKNTSQSCSQVIKIIK